MRYKIWVVIEQQDDEGDNCVDICEPVDVYQFNNKADVARAFKLITEEDPDWTEDDG
jgi:hypothetical protein